ncbi:MAG: hydroxyacid dehydrogenase [Terrimicrobiaceae bacterium]
MVPAIFLGSKPHLKLAFPKDLRTEIGNRCEVLGDDAAAADLPGRSEDLAKVEVIFSTWGVPKLDTEFLKATPRLKALFYAAGSVKGFATPEVYDRGIVISSAWAANAVPVAEYTLATVLLSLKQFWNYSRRVTETRRFGRDLQVAGAYRSKVGLVSLGAVGKLVARKLAPFELDLLAFDPFVDAEAAQELGVSLISLENIFLTCDVVSLHTPWLPETEGLITGNLVRSMKPGATLINTSRGAVINEAGLCEVLAERPDLTAILDVTYPEPPPPDSPLFDLPNAILTPHIAGSMDGEVTRMGRWMVDEFLRHQEGQPLKHIVTRDMLDRMA